MEVHGFNVKHMWTACIPQRHRTGPGCYTTIKKGEKKLLYRIKIYLNYSCAEIWNSACMFVDMQICAWDKTFKAGKGVQTGLDLESRGVTKAGSGWRSVLDDVWVQSKKFFLT